MDDFYYSFCFNKADKQAYRTFLHILVFFSKIVSDKQAIQASYIYTSKLIKFSSLIWLLVYFFGRVVPERKSIQFLKEEEFHFYDRPEPRAKGDFKLPKRGAIAYNFSMLTPADERHAAFDTHAAFDAHAIEESPILTELNRRMCRKKQSKLNGNLNGNLSGNIPSSHENTFEKNRDREETEKY
jgi:hypothetical protein